MKLGDANIKFSIHYIPGYVRNCKTFLLENFSHVWYICRAAVCDVVCLLVVVLLGDKTMDHLYGNGRKIASFSPAGHALVIELL